MAWVLFGLWIAAFMLNIQLHEGRPKRFFVGLVVLIVTAFLLVAM